MLYLYVKALFFNYYEKISIITFQLKYDKMPLFLTVKKTFENTALVLKKFGKQLIQGKKKEINKNVKFLKVGRSIHFSLFITEVNIFMNTLFCIMNLFNFFIR